MVLTGFTADCLSETPEQYWHSFILQLPHLYTNQYATCTERCTSCHSIYNC